MSDDPNVSMKPLLRLMAEERWIPKTERMPEIEEPVLIYTPYNDPELSFQRFRIECNTLLRASAFGATHWQPLHTERSPLGHVRGMTDTMREDAATLNKIGGNWHSYDMPQRKPLWEIADRMQALADAIDAENAKVGICKEICKGNDSTEVGKG